MRRMPALAPALLLVLLLAAPSGAIVYGEPDGGAHPNVGALVIELDGQKGIICSGTLIDADVFLTASHCTAAIERLGLEDAWVTFDSETDVPLDEATTTLIHASWVTHPDFGFAGPGGRSDPHDIAVVLLDEPAAARYPGIQPASLPTAGLLDQMQRARELRGARFTAVGYGVKEIQVGGGPPSHPFDGDRWRAVSSHRALENVWLHLSQNVATGDGGTCFGDSGGPNFLGEFGVNETDVIAAITVTGDAVCRATNVTYRLDTPSARDFLAGFVALP